MMQLDKLMLGRIAKGLGFVRDTLEKVCRLSDILKFFESDDLLSNALAIKGGTAINLTIFDLPRLSVDIDLDYCGNIERNAMMNDRGIISNKISKYMATNGYTLSAKSKNYHALDSFVYEYINAGGVKDNLKIEINYMLRCHVLPLEKRMVNLPWNDEKISVLCVSSIEIFSSKTVALLSRTAPRDLYDIHNMIRFGAVKDDKRALFRKCVVFYSVISMKKPPIEFELCKIGNVTRMQIRRDLVPVLRSGEYFDLVSVQQEVKDFLSDILITDNDEKKFWDNFSKGRYSPELLFSKNLDNIKQHPMALWKCKDIEQTIVEK